MQSAFDNFSRDIGEMKKFLEYMCDLNPTEKLKELVGEFDKVFGYWSNNWENLKKDTEHWKEFNKRINSLKREKLEHARRYVDLNLESLHSPVAIISKQSFVMTISMFEIYLDQKFRGLLRIAPHIYFKHLEKEKGSLDSVDIKLLNKCRFNINQLGSVLIEERKLRYSFQNISSIQEQFSRFDIAIPRTSKIEMYLDIRHVLVHKLGSFDKKFQEKYGYHFESAGQISIVRDDVNEAITEIEDNINNIEEQSNKLYDSIKQQTKVRAGEESNPNQSI